MVSLGLVAVLIGVSALATGAAGYSAGAPQFQCGLMRPTHQQTDRPNENGNFLVTHNIPSPYVPGETYQVMVSSNPPTNFRGFLCEVRNASVVRDASGDGVGLFSSTTFGLLSCGSPNTGITHNGALDNTNSITLDWRAPSVARSDLTVRCTVVETMTTVYTQIPSNTITAPVFDPTATEPPAITVPTQRPVTSIDVDILDACRGSSPSKFCFTQPSSCNSTSDCRFVYTHREVGSDMLEVELFGVTGPESGWLSVAYSADAAMGNDDVLACEVTTGGIVVAKNLHNAGRSNVRDTGSSASPFITPLETLRTSDTLYCRFQRPLMTGATSAGDDFDLSQPWTYFFGSRSTGLGNANGALSGQHNAIPVASTEQYTSQSTGFGSASALSRNAVKAHGILMVLAWTGAASIGMFLARYMKKAWVSKPYWFLFHRGIMISVFILSVASFILIFVDVGEYTNYETHGALGIIVVALAFIQPFMTLLRCGPTDDKRWIFNWAHRGVGAAAQILGIVAIYFGLDAYKDLGFDMDDFYKTTWIVWVAVCAGIWVAFEIYNLVVDPQEEAAPTTDIPMTEKGGSDEPAKPPPKQLIEDYKLRRAVFLTYAFLSVVFALVLCIAIGVADNSIE
ncbi:putative ferric-chelate reductase 1 [Sycon ciliatum]|uniref:putative ferric-chelate reductase 1 n=1 Tax=Sycon ciliatum TaxID=27933 RepID=UPI0031F5F6B5